MTETEKKRTPPLLNRRCARIRVELCLCLPAESGGLTAGTFRGCFRNPLEARQEVDREQHVYGEREKESSRDRAREGVSVGRERDRGGFVLRQRECGRQVS